VPAGRMSRADPCVAAADEQGWEISRQPHARDRAKGRRAYLSEDVSALLAEPAADICEITRASFCAQLPGRR